tara:strand:+ start:913 stop:1047 length:135 start_codon:yes stop_codon:yes gene_type:complete
MPETNEEKSVFDEMSQKPIEKRKNNIKKYLDNYYSKDFLIKLFA